MSNFTIKGAERAIQKACKYADPIEWAAEYGEPGYDAPARGILFANWNPVSRKVCDRLEREGYSLEWSDEWYIDYETGKAYRTSPDCYGWEPRVRFIESGDMLTPDCDPDEWITDSLNSDKRPLPSWFDQSELTAAGFTLLDGDRKEVGFYPGQDDTPEKFTPAIRAVGNEFVLQITGVGQFDVAYRIWTREGE